MRVKGAATVLAGAILVTLCSAPAGAQQPPPAGSAPAPADAEARFAAGQKLYDGKMYDQALVELRASHAATPSPNSRLYIARCLRELGRNAEASSEYALVVLEAAERLDPKYEGTLKAAAAERAALQGGPERPKPPATALAAAETRFFAGQKLYGDKQYEPALVELRASHAAAPSPNSRLYVARCLREMGRVAEAYDEYAQVILEAAERLGAEATKYEGTLKAAATERAAFKDRVAVIVLEVPAGVTGAKLYVGADEIPADRWSREITVPAGEVKVRAEAPGQDPFVRSITVAGGAKQRVAVDLSVHGDVSGAAPAFLRPLAYAVAGVGAVGFVVFGALGEKASSRYDGLLQQCGGRCAPSFQGQVDAGRRETAGSQAGLAIGIVGVAGGVTLWTVDYLMRKRSARPSPSALRIAPTLLGPGLVAGGAF
jgi:tetratricopeptide (TPR) repeat protein